MTRELLGVPADDLREPHRALVSEQGGRVPHMRKTQLDQPAREPPAHHAQQNEPNSLSYRGSQPR